MEYRNKLNLNEQIKYKLITGFSMKLLFAIVVP